MLPASFIQMERFWRNIATYVINLCVDRVLFSFIGKSGWALEHWTYTKRNMLTEVDHIGHKFVKYYCLKLAGSVMKYWLYFVDVLDETS